jgi:hypothetical protein
MVVFLPRPSAILLLNQSDSADCGWFCSHSQASSISADLRRGFPALETPCSWLTEPLCHGVGASPA